MRNSLLYDAVLFDLLTALLDSWSLWATAASSDQEGRRWRDEYLRLTYGWGDYEPYEQLVAGAARNVGIPTQAVLKLVESWSEIMPWPETSRVVEAIAGGGAKIGVVTNCSNRLGAIAAARVGVRFDVVVTAEMAGAYKPRPEPYLLALEQLGSDPSRTLFVAGSRFDIAGAGSLGMPVWWHNRIGMPRGDAPTPLYEARSLDELIGALDRP